MRQIEHTCLESEQNAETRKEKSTLVTCVQWVRYTAITWLEGRKKSVANIHSNGIMDYCHTRNTEEEKHGFARLVLNVGKGLDEAKRSERAC